jgi:type VI secretion system protein ImpC
MPERESLGNAGFEFRTLTSFAPRKAKNDAPFCIAVLADFSGRGNRGVCETGPAFAIRQRILVDVDNLDELPGKLGCRLRIPLGGKDVSAWPLEFGELDDFHPDRIVERLEVFLQLKKTRELLQDPATFSEASAQVQSWAGTDRETPESRDEPTKGVQEQDESDSDTVERLLGKAASQQQAGTSRSADIDSMIREIVEPYIVPAPDPQQAEMIAQIDRALGHRMRAIVHHPDFQELEAVWRILHFLVSRIETGETLGIYVIDISKAELAADLGAVETVESTGAYKLFVQQSVGTPGAESYSVLFGAYTFDETAEDIRLLRQLGRLAQAAGAPWLTAAHSHFAGCESIATTPDPDDWRRQADASALRPWQELRRSPEAAYIGLVLPRFLLRLPYGGDTDAIDEFDFEEFSPLAGHEQYLWGNSAALCACLLARAFKEFGWTFTAGLRSELTGMPMHIYESDGTKHIIPCAETILTERAMEVLTGKGFMPVLSIKGRDAVRLPWFQSIADPPAPLAGPWR